jgi:hypothetical protein
MGGTPGGRFGRNNNPFVSDASSGIVTTHALGIKLFR